jgi:hypothetical protein
VLSTGDESVIDVERLRALLEHLTAHPEMHNQVEWAIREDRGNRPCKTAYCAAGWAVVLDDHYSIIWHATSGGESFGTHASGPDGKHKTIREVAQELLSFETWQASRFFRTSNSLHDLWSYANT